MPVSIEERDDYLASLASNGWLRHVRQVLIAACKTAVRVAHQAVSVLVHCSGMSTSPSPSPSPSP